LPLRIKCANNPSNAMRPKHTTTRKFGSNRNSSSSHGAQLRSSSGVGLLPGGAQCATEVIHSPLSFMPSSRETALGCEANPAACSTGYKKSPEPSPVNGRPVRFDPCAPGASPNASTRAPGSPNEGTGLPQYSHSAYARRFTFATSAQCARSLAQSSHATIF